MSQLFHGSGELLLENLDELRSIQRKVAGKMVLKDRFKKPITTVAGIDLAFLDDVAITACVVTDYCSLKVQSSKITVAKLDFPYIPTFLSFREGPPLIDIIKYIEPKPDLFLINAHGLAHPLLCGCASHVGVLASVPTIGVAARKLCGEFDPEPEAVGDYVPLYYRRRAVGWVLKSKKGCKPIYISPGHLVSLSSSLHVVLKCIHHHKFPEPLHFAHVLAVKEKRKVTQQS